MYWRTGYYEGEIAKMFADSFSWKNVRDKSEKETMPMQLYKKYLIDLQKKEAALGRWKSTTLEDNAWW